MTRWRRHANSISQYSQILFWRFLVPRSDSGLMFSSPMNTKVAPARAVRFGRKPKLTPQALARILPSLVAEDQVALELREAAQQ
jgi:hypothetical protein